MINFMFMGKFPTHFIWQLVKAVPVAMFLTNALFFGCGWRGDGLPLAFALIISHGAKAGPASLFYACPKCHSENRSKRERACSNRLSIDVPQCFGSPAKGPAIKCRSTKGIS